MTMKLWLALKYKKSNRHPGRTYAEKLKEPDEIRDYFDGLLMIDISFASLSISEPDDFLCKTAGKFGAFRRGLNGFIFTIILFWIKRNHSIS